MAVYPSAVSISIATGTSAWLDITNRVVSDLQAEVGMADTSYETRLADPGYLFFEVDNDDGVYTPDDRLKKGTPVKVEVTYDDKERVKFYGVVEEADVDVGTSGEQKTRVTAVQWLQYTMEQHVRVRPVEINKRMDEGIYGLLSDMPVQPVTVLIDEGNTIFPTIYDEVDRDTTIYREMNNLIMSEYGYGYMDRGGERFRVENRNARNGIQELNLLPAAQDGSTLLLASGTNRHLLLVDGVSRLLLNPTQPAFYSGTFPAEYDNPKITYGKNTLNEIEFIVYPKEVDDFAVTLFSLQEPLLIPALATKEFTAFFSDPNGGGQVGGTDLVALVTGTHYSAFQYSTASGTVYTSNLTITTEPASNGVKYTIVNSGVACWLTTLIQKGKGIYPYGATNTIATNQESRDLYGVKTLSIRQPYQQTLDLGKDESEKILDTERLPRHVLTQARMVANASDLHMQSFMHLDIGSLVRIVTGKPATDSYYHINGMKWTIERGGWTTYTWFLKEFPTFTPLAIDFSGVSSSQNAIDYGVPGALTNLATRTYSAWINLKAIAKSAPIMGKYSSAGQAAFHLFPDGHLRFLIGFTNQVGQWRTLNPNLTGTAPVDRWLHLAVTYDATDINNNPVMYVTGSSVSITEESAPLGVKSDDSEIRFMLGNAAYPLNEWAYTPNFVIKDARVYNRVLSAEEIATLNANPNDYTTVPDGMVFNAPFVRSSLYDNYLDQQITDDVRVFDRVNTVAGQAHYATLTGSYYIYGRDPSLSSY